MDILNKMTKHGHEQVTMYHDPDSGLRGIIAIHDTTPGAVLRRHPDVALRFRSRRAGRRACACPQAMTYKSAAAGLNLGGGKGVIIGDPRADKTEGLLRAWGPLRGHPGAGAT